MPVKLYIDYRDSVHLVGEEQIENTGMHEVMGNFDNVVKVGTLEFWHSKVFILVMLTAQTII